MKKYRLVSSYILRLKMSTTWKGKFGWFFIFSCTTFHCCWSCA